VGRIKGHRVGSGRGQRSEHVFTQAEVKREKVKLDGAFFKKIGVMSFTGHSPF